MSKRKSQGDVSNASNDGKCVWTNAMDDALIDAYVYQHNMGNRQGGTFTSKALDEILLEMREKFPNKQFDKTKIKDHMKRLKSKFTPCYDLFKNGLSGFGWNSNTNLWTAEPEVWDKLIEAKSEAAIWKNKPIPYYEKMLLLYGQDRASGEYAETTSEIRQRRSASNGTEFDSIEDIDILISNNEAILQNCDVNNDEEIQISPESRSQVATTSKNKKKKSNVANEELCIEMFAKSLNGVVEAFRKCTEDIVNSQRTRPMSESEVWGLLEGLQLDRNTLIRAYMHIVRDDDAQRTLIGCPQEMRKEVVMILMSSKDNDSAP